MTKATSPGVTSGAIAASGSGSWWTTAKSTAGIEGPVNGRFPVSIS